MAGGFWDEERTERLKNLVAEGHSFSAICVILGAPSRSAVIGKAFRLKLPSTNPARKRGAPTQRRKQRHNNDAIYAFNARKNALRPGAKTFFGDEKLIVDGKTQMRRILELLRQGKSRPEVAEILGITVNAVASAHNESLIGAERNDASIDIARKALLDLDNGDCRWPVGDPQKEGFGFCAAPRRPGKPYCDGHLKRAERPLVQDSTLSGRAAAGEHPVDATREHNSQDSSNLMPVKENA